MGGAARVPKSLPQIQITSSNLSANKKFSLGVPSTQRVPSRLPESSGFGFVRGLGS